MGKFLSDLDTDAKRQGRPLAHAQKRAAASGFRATYSVRGGVSGAGKFGMAVAASSSKRRSTSFLQGETRLGLGAGSAKDLTLDDAGAGPGLWRGLVD